MPYLLTAVVWLMVAVIAGAAGLPARLTPPAPQLLLLTLTLLLLLAGRFDARLRAWLDRLGWRPLVALHLTRFVGIYFLLLWRRGELPYAFAVPGGIGDIVVAVLAALLLARYRRQAPSRLALLGWNAIGLADILFVAATAARLALTDPPSMQALLRLPLSLLVTFLVPLIIATHVWLFRIGAAGARPAGDLPGRGPPAGR